MIGLSVRSAIPADIPTLREFEQGIVKAERPFDETLRPDPITYHDIEKLVDSPDSELAVAEFEGRLIGCGFAVKKVSRHYTEPEYHALLGCMYVVEEFRGQGVIQAVQQYLMDWAKNNGLLEIRLTVYPGNNPAVKAYEKAGFEAHILEMRKRLED